MSKITQKLDKKLTDIYAGKAIAKFGERKPYFSTMG